MTADAGLVVTTSAWAHDSPPLARLYEALGAAGVEVRDGDLTTFVRAAPRAGGRREVFHLNWIDHVAGGRPRALRAVAAAKLLAVLTVARLRRRHVWWTVHNLEPHERNRSATYAAVLPVVHLLVGTVHHLSETTRATFARRHPLVARLGRTKVVTTPMPASGHHGRGAPPVPAGHPIATFLVFGLLRPSKGVAELITSFVAAGATGPARRLVVAGAPVDERYGAALRAAAADDDRVDLRLRRLDDGELADTLASAHWAVLPYRRITNSAALVAALEAGLPVLGTDAPLFREVLAGHDRAGILFDLASAPTPDDWSGWATGALEPGHEERRAAARQVAARHDPAAVATTLVRHLSTIDRSTRRGGRYRTTDPEEPSSDRLARSAIQDWSMSTSQSS